MAEAKTTYGISAKERENRTKGAEIFIGGLARSVTDSMIREMCSPYGEVLEVRMTKGFCFVRFASKEAAVKAQKEKDGFMLNGKKIGIAQSTDQDTLFFGNLRKDWSFEEFDKLIRQAFPDVLSVDLAIQANTKDSSAGKKLENRGFAFVRFSSHGTKVAFVGNLPSNADEDYLMQLFKPFGMIEKVALSRRSHFPVGFVHFAKRSDLDSVIRDMDGQIVEGPHKGPPLKIQVSIARPPEKDRKRPCSEPHSKEGSKLASQPTALIDSRTLLGDQKYKAPRLTHTIKVPHVTDPYEAAVISLPSAVKERLLRILRLEIATRYDIDICCITRLRELPHSEALTVLDKFMLSGADVQNKGAYFTSLIVQHQVDKLRTDSKLLHLRSAGDFSYREPEPFNIRASVQASTLDPVSSRTLGSAAARYNALTISPELKLRSSLPSVEPYLPRPGTGTLGEIGFSYKPPISSSTNYGGSSGGLSLDSYFKLSHRASTANQPLQRPQVKFDPFTGQPYKFDPFTGEPIQHDLLPRHSAGRL
ncbi:Polyadenylate-binding protein RBP45 [Acorus gramineus]|uniref:Polyadenylate-binding protein RBP45 n=1 Tax=Acorus gramineus TaxID=55184 RepID=A0AAV9B8R3_ACOGR|nr:Polyadenylate-binding protein RBP45 [Acorus gramineus]